MTLVGARAKLAAGPTSALGAARAIHVAPGERTRLAGLDSARLLASLATVWYHGAQSHQLDRVQELGRFGVGFFGMAAAFFLVRGVRRHPEIGLAQYAKARFRRLYIPMLAWTAILLVLAEGRKHLGHGGEHVELEWSMLWGGSQEYALYHLWFLPFLLLISVASYPLVRATLGHPGRTRALAAALIGVSLLAAYLNNSPGNDDRSFTANLFGQNYFAYKCVERCPGFLWGLVLGLLWAPESDRPRVSGWISTLGAVLLVGSLAVVSAMGHKTLPENLAGVGLFLIAMGPAADMVRGWPARLGTLSYGVYLIHPMLIQGVLAPEKHLGFGGEPWWYDIMTVVIAALGSLALTAALRSFKQTRWLIP